MDEKLIRLANILMDSAKLNIKEDGELQSMVILVSKDKNSDAIIPVSFDNLEERNAAYANIARIARGMDAVAAVTINDVFFKAGTFEEAQKLKPGDLKRDKSAREAIVVTVKAPEQESYTLIAEYVRDERHGQPRIKFSPRRVISSGNPFINLVPDWWVTQ